MKICALLVAVLIAAFFPISILGDERWKGRGAKVPFVEVEAEHAHHNGREIGNERKYGTLSSEASGRRAVQLNSVGQFVEFTLPIRANSIVVRYSIPDSHDGAGLDANLDLFVSGKKLQPLQLTSRYSWFYGGYPFNNHPGDTNPHHFYDETRAMFDQTYEQGSKVKLVVSSTSIASTFTIDLVDFELVGPPHPQPAGSISVVEAGADPTGKKDSTAAFQKAVDDGRGQHRTVYIPSGKYMLYNHVIVDQVRIVGAGPWYSVLGGRHPNERQKTGGIFGKYDADGGASRNVYLENFAFIGDIRERDDSAPTTAIGGSMTDSIVDNLWLQHVKCGAWFEGRMNNFTMRNTRILDTTADGVNFHKGVTNSVVENTFVRNTGDDGLAMWADIIPEIKNRFVRNTVTLPILANNIAIYGGRDIEVSDNLIMDTVTNGGGIHVANRFTNVRGETGVKGHFKIHRNTLLRAGSSDTNWRFGVGAIWFNGLNDDIHADIHVKDCDIIDSSYEAIAFIEGNVFGTRFENVNINGTGTYVLQIQGSGDINFASTNAINVGHSPPVFNCNHPFKINFAGAEPEWYRGKSECTNDDILRSLHPIYKWKW